MTGFARGSVAAVTIMMIAAAPFPAAASSPEKLEVPTFAVALTNSAGEPQSSFSQRDPPHFEINFALALSESKRYPVKITLIQDAGGKITETEFFNGNLSEGFYRYSFTVDKLPASRGVVNYRLVVKVRVYSQPFAGSSYYKYLKHEGSYRIGR